MRTYGNQGDGIIIVKAVTQLGSFSEARDRILGYAMYSIALTPPVTIDYRDMLTAATSKCFSVSGRIFSTCSPNFAILDMD